MNEVIGHKFIWEFDFPTYFLPPPPLGPPGVPWGGGGRKVGAGFFNSVKLESVARHLLKYSVPKYMTAHLINLCASVVTNILPSDLVEKLGNRATSDSRRNAWEKYEYIHKFRKKPGGEAQL